MAYGEVVSSNDFDRVDKVYQVYPKMIKNIKYIYGGNYSKIRLFFVVLISILALPIYSIITLILLLRLSLLVFLFSPFYLAKIVVGYTWGMDDPIMGIVMLPISATYLAVHFISVIPFMLLALVGDIMARLISPRNHHPKYDMLVMIPVIAPHIEMKADLKNMNR